MSDGANLGNEDSDRLSVSEFLANVNCPFDEVQLSDIVSFFLQPWTLVHSTESGLMSRHAIFNEIRTLDPLKDHLRIVHLINWKAERICCLTICNLLFC
jgi:hypothetical protein